MAAFSHQPMSTLKTFECLFSSSSVKHLHISNKGSGVEPSTCLDAGEVADRQVVGAVRVALLGGFPEPDHGHFLSKQPRAVLKANQPLQLAIAGNSAAY